MKRFQLFEAYTASSASHQLEKEAAKFFSALEPLMSKDAKFEEALASLKQAISRNPKGEAFKSTEAYLNFSNKFFDFFGIEI